MNDNLHTRFRQVLDPTTITPQQLPSEGAIASLRGPIKVHLDPFLDLGLVDVLCINVRNRHDR